MAYYSQYSAPSSNYAGSSASSDTSPGADACATDSHNLACYAHGPIPQPSHSSPMYLHAPGVASVPVLPAVPTYETTPVSTWTYDKVAVHRGASVVAFAKTQEWKSAAIDFKDDASFMDAWVSQQRQPVANKPISFTTGTSSPSSVFYASPLSTLVRGPVAATHVRTDPVRTLASTHIMSHLTAASSLGAYTPAFKF